MRSGKTNSWYGSNWYRYRVKGVLSKTANETPSKFTIEGACNETWSISKKIEQQKHTGAIIIPRDSKLYTFFAEIPLGTTVIFKEAVKRSNGKSFSSSYSVQVVEKKKTTKKRR
jgi:hypothetical protein